MPIAITRILQIGDVHYPDWPATREGRDLAQRVHPEEMIDQIGFLRMERILGSIVDTIATERPDSICLVGDLTTKGDQAHLLKAVLHLSSIFRAPYGTSHQPKTLMVPGNHDIAKKEATENGLIGKFSTIRKIGERARWAPVPIDAPTIVDIGSIESSVRLYGINTCLGSWELSSLGTSVLKKIEELQRRMTSDALGVATATKRTKRPISFEDLHYDNYDAPFVHQATLKILSSDISKIPPHTLAVVVGHHNILSQEIPRYAPFADLINGGSLRRSLQYPRRPVVYLHGHIHTDPMELVQQVEIPASQIYSISAPELKSGYNLIEVYSSVGKRPLGIRLRRFRIEQNGNVTEQPEIRSAFYTSPRQRRLSSRTQSLLAYLDQERNIHFRRLSDSRMLTQISMGSDELESELQELYWGDMIDIENVFSPRETWTIIAGHR